jgi:integrase
MANCRVNKCGLSFGESPRSIGRNRAPAGGVAQCPTRQYSRIVGSWVWSIGLNPAAYGTHSLRRTKPTLIYRRTKNLRAVQLLLGHSKLESTVRYLGIEVDDALEIAEQTEV